MKKSTKITLSLAVLMISGVIAGVVFFLDGFSKPEDRVLTEAVVLEDENQSQEAESESEAKKDEAKEKVITTESEFMEVLHHMTHQKVEASPKWGAVQITEQRIDQMLAVLESNELEHEAFYHKTLSAWKKGDFSNAVHTHNEIWDMQNGTIGEATDLLSEAEEEKYIETHFD